MKLRPTNAYVMSKPLKTLLAGILDPHARGEFKQTMIEAELTAKQKAPDRNVYLSEDQKQPAKSKSVADKPQ